MLKSYVQQQNQDAVLKLKHAPGKETVVLICISILLHILILLFHTLPQSIAERLVFGKDQLSRFELSLTSSFDCRTRASCGASQALQTKLQVDKI